MAPLSLQTSHGVPYPLNIISLFLKIYNIVHPKFIYIQITNSNHCKEKWQFNVVNAKKNRIIACHEDTLWGAV